MKKNIFLFFLFAFSSIISQTKYDILKFSDLFLKKEKPPLFFSEPRQQFSIKLICSMNTITQTNKKPMFCKMEDKIHKHFNVWILLRAGSDLDYRKLISNPND